MSKLKLLTVACVGALALTAFALASSASAQWMVKGTTLTGSETKALATTAAVDEHGKLKAAGVTIECNGNTLNGTGPMIEASGEKGSATSLTFNECSANSNCTVATTIATVPLVADTPIIEGNKDISTIFLPKTKTIFATIKFNGAECALLGTQPVAGKAKINAPTGAAENTLQEIQAEVQEASGELKVGSSAAELKGAALLKLTTNEPWSFLVRDSIIAVFVADTGTVTNPLDLLIAITRIAHIPGGGPILAGGSCAVGAHIAPLGACTILQDNPTGAGIEFNLL